MNIELFRKYKYDLMIDNTNSELSEELNWLSEELNEFGLKLNELNSELDGFG